MPELILDVPTNLRLPPGTKARHVDSDMWNICERLREYDPRMSIIMLEYAAGVRWAIMERGPDGVDRMVCRVKELDARVIDECRRMAAIPADERLKVLEAEIAKERAQADTDAQDALYEKIGGGFYDGLYASGFTQSAKPMSVRPLNRAARRAGRKIR